ncbi:hypothetical protein [Sulfurovum sp.]|uniref:hypothetical protein n=1 Tax=Sulfurovum sp. TaxID=1969726 RepID=UPI002867D7AA|nr:hypothetical protein [Sulfurovum sp.]
MDKTGNTLVADKQREGFALLVTLSVLTVIIALTTVLLSYLDEVREDASQTKALIQANVYYADITKVFNDLKDKKTLFSTLYLAPFPIASEDGRFMMSVACKPLSNAVNINWLGSGSDPEMLEPYVLAQTVFDFLVQEYDLEDGMRLQEIILDEIGDEESFVQGVYSRFRQKNGIISYQQFTAILSRYQFEVDDEKVSKIPWDRYFSFSGSSNVVDAEYSSPELIALMFEIDLQSVQEWYEDPARSSLETFITMNGGDYAKRKKILAGETFLEESTCMVSYEIAEKPYRFSFEYVQGEAKYFEFYGKQ